MEEKIRIENYSESVPHPEIKKIAVEAMETRGQEEISGKEAVKRALAPSFEKARMATPVSLAQSAASDTEQDVDELVELAVSEGVSKAISRAAEKGAFFLDAFHDKLAEKIHNEFSK